MSLLERAWQHYHQRGVRSLIASSIRFSKNNIYRTVDGLYWRVKRRYELTCGGMQLGFNAIPPAARKELLHFSEPNEGMLLESVIDELNESDVFVDVGANIGVYTCFGAAVTTEGATVAFEPYPPNVELVQQNLDLNGLSAKVFNYALSDDSGNMSLSVPSTDTPGWGESTIHQKDTETMEIEVRTLDELVEKELLPSPNVVKIDVEGAESLVLEGMTQTLSDDNCRCLFIEIHRPKDGRPSIEDFGYSESALLERISSFGFGLEEVYERGPEVHVKAKQS